MNDWLSKNFWLKLVALILAIIVWSYARQELKNTPGYKAEKVAHNETPTVIPQK
ncbi:MAG: hypothetical protein PHX64_02530 [Candidatus Omnitrophica bacterium]|nr:hypothetical protein [Candidatus Omnitrophota bacterium]MDD5310611.1 hypothetical protein [Candidatus Omnitrophota bacterium]MDD5545615.1 hypothetical protein [Candidatus Omnitrophota bacterium]